MIRLFNPIALRRQLFLETQAGESSLICDGQPHMLHVIGQIKGQKLKSDAGDRHNTGLSPSLCRPRPRGGAGSTSAVALFKRAIAIFYSFDLH